MGAPLMKISVTPPVVNGSPGIRLGFLHGCVVAAYLLFPLTQAGGNIAIVIMAVAWFASGRPFRNAKAIAANPVNKSIALLLFLVLAGSLGRDIPTEDVLRALSKYAKLLLIPILFDLLDDQPKLRQRCTAAFLFATIVIIVLTYGSLLLRGVGIDTQDTRTRAVFADYLVQSILMTVFMVLCVLQVVENSSVRWKSAWSAAFVLAAGYVFYVSIGRTGIVMVIVAAAVGLCRVRARWFLPSLALTFAVVTANVLNSEPMRERWNLAMTELRQADSDRMSSIGTRLYNFRTTAEMIAEKPILGHGTGSYRTKVCRYIVPPYNCASFNWHPHNQYLLFGAELGLPGLLAYCFVIVSLGAASRRITNTSHRFAFFAVVAMLAVDSLFNSPVWSARESELFLLVIGLLGASQTIPGKEARHEGA